MEEKTVFRDYSLSGKQERALYEGKRISKGWQREGGWLVVTPGRAGTEHTRGCCGQGVRGAYTQGADRPAEV